MKYKIYKINIDIIPVINKMAMMVIKRSGMYEEISYDIINQTLNQICLVHKISIDTRQLCLKVIDQLYDKIPTTKISELIAEQCVSMTTTHSDYGKIASSIIMLNHQKKTPKTFYESVKKLYEFRDNNENSAPLISDVLWSVLNKNMNEIEEMIIHNRDYYIDYFGFKTLERVYLMKCNNVIVETPQYMWMRVSLGIHGNDLKNVKKTYDLMSNLVFTHATPTLFNAGTPRPQLSSCFLLSMQDDSIDGIYETLKECAKISKWAGGIGLNIHNIRATGTHIRGTNGTSNGIIPMLRVFNATARYVDQGGGKRNGSFAVYIEPWHADIEMFLEAKMNHGDEELRSRDLFYALWIPDYFMKCVETNSDWHLFCPDEAKGLSEVVGDEFVERYNKYVKENKYRKVIKARDLWYKVLDSQMETGTPYLLYKDSSNNKSNQKNLGIIKSSNLCTEIIEYTSSEETAVCNLASISLAKCVKRNESGVYFDYNILHEVTKHVAFNLDRVIDVNYYPNEKCARSNRYHRPIGIGVQGFADALMMLDVAFTSNEAKIINKNIFETIYHAALETSNEIAMNRKSLMCKVLNDNVRVVNSNKAHHYYISNDKQINTSFEMEHLSPPIFKEIYNLTPKYAGAYSSFIGSPAEKGQLQYDLWGVTPSARYDWASLKLSIAKHGLRNSLLVAPMPTASTSMILGNNECFEPYTSNIYTRRTLAGEFVMMNKHLQNELISMKLWSLDVKNNIIENKGSVQNVDCLSIHMKEKYKTAWEIPMKTLIDMSADRGAYVCQSQSLNLWLEEPNYKNLTSMHFYGWKKGLKTGMYYLRRKPKHHAQQFTIIPKVQTESTEECVTCSA